jgi:hypothetical protein
MTITKLISMLNGVGAYRKEKFNPSVFRHVLNSTLAIFERKG